MKPTNKNDYLLFTTTWEDYLINYELQHYLNVFNLATREETTSSTHTRSVNYIYTCVLLVSYTYLTNISFLYYLLPLLEYCSPVRGSAADSHLKFVYRLSVVHFFLSGGRARILSHRRDVASSCMLSKAWSTLQPANALV